MKNGKAFWSNPLTTVVTLAASAYTSNASRAVGAILLRMVLDPISVGLINSLQALGNVLAPVTLGSPYGALRSIPARPLSERAPLASRAFSAALIEALIVCTIAVPIAMPFLGGGVHHASLLWAAVPFVVIYRMLTIQESLLLTLQEFAVVIRTRLIRTVEPFVGVLAALLWRTPLSFIVASTLVAGSCLLLRRQKYMAPTGGVRGLLRDGIRFIAQTDKYCVQISLDRMSATAANYIDVLLVAALAGPGSLAGYYLGVNIRGLLFNVPNAIFWQRWTASVEAYDSEGHDAFTNVRFLLRMWLTLCSMLGLSLVALWVAVVTVIPHYRSYMAEAAIAAAIAVPYSLSAMVRGRRMLDKKVGRLMLFSWARLGAFAAALAILHAYVEGPLQAVTIAYAGYAGAAIECMIICADLARHDGRWRFLLAIALMVAVPPALLETIFR